MPEVLDPEGQDNAYGHMLNRSRSAWAWEFLRRNPDMWQKWKKAQPDLEVGSPEERVRVVQIRHQPAHEPCPVLFASSLKHDAETATVVWNPEILRSALRAIAVQPHEAPSGTPFAITELRHETTLLIAPDGVQHLLVRNGSSNLQLAVSGRSLLEQVVLVVDTIADVSIADAQIASLRRFHDLRRTGVLDAAERLAFSRAKSYAMKLTALDMSLAGATQREIAIALFGEDAGAQWTKDENLRHRVRYNIVSGHALMDHGYRALLAVPQLSRRSR